MKIIWFLDFYRKIVLRAGLSLRAFFTAPGTGTELSASTSPRGLRQKGHWICRRCNTEQRAVVEIADRKAHRIEGVTLNRATRETANFISEVDAELLAEALQGAQPMTGASSVEILRRRLR